MQLVASRVLRNQPAANARRQTLSRASCTESAAFCTMADPLQPLSRAPFRDLIADRENAKSVTVGRCHLDTPTELAAVVVEFVLADVLNRINLARGGKNVVLIADIDCVHMIQSCMDPIRLYTSGVMSEAATGGSHRQCTLCAVPRPDHGILYVAFICANAT